MRRTFLYVFVVLAVLGVIALGSRKMFAQSGLAPSMITQAVDEHQLVTLRGNVHPLAQAKYDQGLAPSDMQMGRMLLVLKRSPEQQTALDNLNAQQADKNSPNYLKWLTPAQFGQQFGPSDQDVNDITMWLESHGLQVSGASIGRNMIEFSGTASQIGEAFHTQIHHFVVNGENHYANVSDPQIPAALAPLVVSVSKLNDFRPKPMHRDFGQFRMTLPGRHVTAVKPNFTFNSGTSGTCLSGTANCYTVAPYDFATIYNLLPVWNTTCAGAVPCNGTGEKIAIVSDSAINAPDFNTFRSIMGLPAGTLNQIVPPGMNNPGVQGPTCAVNKDESEAVADVEWSGAAAPGATIDLVEAPSATIDSCGNVATTGEGSLPNGSTGYSSSFGGDYAAYYAINNLPDKILSDSYGECELGLGPSGNAFYSTLWQQASTQGITVVVASGDAGAAGCDSGAPVASFGLEVNGSASTPFDTAVGGTDFAYITSSVAANYWNATNSASGSTVTLSAKGPIPETVYNDTCTNPELFPTFGASMASNACNSALAGENPATLEPVGSGGGVSSCTNPDGPGAQDCQSSGYTKPSWQTAGTPADGHRDVPDLSLFSGDLQVSGSFYIVCQEDTNTAEGDAACSLTPSNGTFLFEAGGGTSIAAQAFAGLVAVLDQVHGKSYGSVALNTQLYSLAASPGQTGLNCNSSVTAAPASACDFRDITTGTNSMACITGSPNCGTSSSSHVIPGAPHVAFRWTPLNVTVLVCGFCAALGMLLWPGNNRRWSTALALLLLVAVFGAASCGGGASGTGAPGGGNDVGVLSGYNAGTGYDRATGLGSVNAQALINASGW
jgi:hypothetical protein